MLGYRFSKYSPQDQSPFDKLFDIFKQLLTFTSGDVGEALSWLTELDKEYELTNEEYGMGDFIEDLKRKGYLRDDPNEGGGFAITPKTEQAIRQSALERIFGKLKKGKSGNHKTRFTGAGDEVSSDMRDYQFGDSVDQIAMLESFRNAQINHGIGEFMMNEDDLLVHEREHKTQTSTVLMIGVGRKPASTMKRLSWSKLRHHGSQTCAAGSLPIRVVPHWCEGRRPSTSWLGRIG